MFFFLAYFTLYNRLLHSSSMLHQNSSFWKIRWNVFFRPTFSSGRIVFLSTSQPNYFLSNCFFFFGQVIWSVLKLRQFPRLSSRCLHCALMVRKPLTCRRNLTLSHHLPLGHMTLETVVCFSSELEVRLLLTHPSIHPSIHLSIHPSLHPAIQASIHPVWWALA